MLAKHRAAWPAGGNRSMCRSRDDPAAELAIRYALFSCGAIPGRHDELAVGARGLSGTGYAGHVFWDADVFVLPALVEHRSARGAGDGPVQAAPSRRGEGAGTRRWPGWCRLSWKSAVTGEDVTPLSGHVGGDLVPILTGQQEEHVTADVTHGGGALRRVDRRSMASGAARVSLLAETARYLASRCGVIPATPCT